MNKLESTFIEIVNPKTSIIIVGVVYRYSFRDRNDVNSSYLDKMVSCTNSVAKALKN